MYSKIKTYLSIPLLFLIVALLWSIAGNVLFDLPKLEKDKRDKENIISLINIIYAKNFDKSVKFYTDLIGLKLIANVQDISGIQLAKLNLSSINLQIRSIKNDSLENADQFSKLHKMRLLFEVSNIKSIYEKVEANGIKLNDYYKSIDGNLTFDVKDPDGNTISFIEKY
jgi:predicted enzyme related to lactoylglutathione lyase